MSDFTHFNEQGRAKMVDVGEKPLSRRTAVAGARVLVNEKTFDLIRGLAGQGTVVRTSGFNINEKFGSDYRDSMSTTVEKEDRIDLRDLQEQIEGEAHFVFSGQIVRGDMFFANPSLKKAQLRVPQLLQFSLETDNAQAKKQ